VLLLARPPAATTGPRHAAARAWAEAQQRAHDARPWSGGQPPPNLPPGQGESSRSSSSSCSSLEKRLHELRSRPRSRQQPAAAAPYSQVAGSAIWPGDANRPLTPGLGLPSALLSGDAETPDFRAFFGGGPEGADVHEQLPPGSDSGFTGGILLASPVKLASDGTDPPADRRATPAPLRAPTPEDGAARAGSVSEAPLALTFAPRPPLQAATLADARARPASPGLPHLLGNRGAYGDYI
jgi:hypothetical protein